MAGLALGRGVPVTEGPKEGFGGLAVVEELYGLPLTHKEGVATGFGQGFEFSGRDFQDFSAGEHLLCYSTGTVDEQGKAAKASILPGDLHTVAKNGKVIAAADLYGLNGKQAVRKSVGDGTAGADFLTVLRAERGGRAGIGSGADPCGIGHNTGCGRSGCDIIPAPWEVTTKVRVKAGNFINKLA